MRRARKEIGSGRAERVRPTEAAGGRTRRGSLSATAASAQGPGPARAPRTPPGHRAGKLNLGAAGIRAAEITHQALGGERWRWLREAQALPPGFELVWDTHRGPGRGMLQGTGQAPPQRQPSLLWPVLGLGLPICEMAPTEALGVVLRSLRPLRLPPGPAFSSACAPRGGFLHSRRFPVLFPMGPTTRPFLPGSSQTRWGRASCEAC